MVTPTAAVVTPSRRRRWWRWLARALVALGLVAGLALVWPHATVEEVVRSYRLITAGLRANAHRRLGELDAAQAALETRRALALERLAQSDIDDHLRAVALVEARLADNARDRHDAAGAARYLGQAPTHAYKLRKRTGAPVERAQLDVLWLAAELRAQTHVDLPFNLPRRLRHAYDRMVKQNDAAWRGYQRWFELYLTLLSPLRRGRHADGSDVLDPTQDAPGDEATRRPPPSPVRRPPPPIAALTLHRARGPSDHGYSLAPPRAVAGRDFREDCPFGRIAATNCRIFSWTPTLYDGCLDGCARSERAPRGEVTL